jgi:hypothetical protein
MLGFAEAFVEVRLRGVFAHDRKFLSKKIPCESKLEVHEHLEFDISDPSSLTADEWTQKLEFARLSFSAFVEERATQATRFVGSAELPLVAVLRAKRETVTLHFTDMPSGVFGLKFPSFSGSSPSLTVQASLEPALEFPLSQISLVSGKEPKELLGHIAAFMEKHGKAAASRLLFPTDINGSSFLINRLLYPMRPPVDIVGNMLEFVASMPRFSAFRDDESSSRARIWSGYLFWREFLEIGVGEGHAVLLCNLMNGQDTSSYAEPTGKSYLAALDRFGEPQLAVLRVPNRADYAELYFPSKGEFMRFKLNKEIDTSVTIHAVADADNIFMNSEGERVFKLDSWPVLFNAHDKYRFFRDGVMEREMVELSEIRKFSETSDLLKLADRICTKIEFGIRDLRSGDNPNSLTRMNQAYRPALMEILNACEEARWGLREDTAAMAMSNFQANAAYGRVVIGRPQKFHLVDYAEIWAQIKASRVANVANDRTEFGVAVLISERTGVVTLWTLVVAVLPKEF